MSEEICENHEMERRISRLAADRLFKPADQDYVTSRLLYHHGMSRQFFWSALQSLEKYLKCALILRNLSARDGHNLKKLFAKLRNYPETEPLPAVPHEHLEPILGNQFDQPSIEQVILKIDRFGHPKNRYGEGFIDWNIRDLIAYDYAILWARNQCLRNSRFGFPYLLRTAPSGVNCFSSVDIDNDLEPSLRFNNFAFFPDGEIAQGKGAVIWINPSPQHEHELSNPNSARYRIATNAEEKFKSYLFKPKTQDKHLCKECGTRVHS